MRQFDRAYMDIISQMNTRGVVDSFREFFPKAGIKLKSGWLYKRFDCLYLTQFATLNGQKVVIIYKYDNCVFRKPNQSEHPMRFTSLRLTMPSAGWTMKS